MTTQVHNEDLLFTVHVFKEGDVFIAYVPQLDVSSCGDTATAARRNIQDAVSLLLETSKERGTLTDILEEAGYRHEGRLYRHGFLGQPGECIHAAGVSANARRTTAGARKPWRYTRVSQTVQTV